MMSYNYVDTPNSNLICCICRMPFSNPVSARTCSHTFCHDCIVRAMEHSPHCPVDRSKLSPDDLVPASTIIRNLVDELIVQCPQRSRGCGYICQRQLLASHMRATCEFVEVPCSSDQCSNTAHEPECPKREVKCEFCADEFPYAELSLHNDSCPDFVVGCTHAPNGCPWTGPRRTLASSHIPTCPYEAIKGFFSINSARISGLTDENTLLRHKAEVLEGAVQTMARELRIVKAALGPWYRPDGVYSPPPRDIPPSDDFSYDPRIPASSPHTPGGFASPAELGMRSPQASPFDAPPPSTDADILAAYFPPEAESAAHAPQQRVAPVNLSTTLEGSFAGVRESVVALSAALDSLARRQEIAQTSEAVRLNEELRSLRGSVHGLRVQLHRIMMERNAQVTGRVGEASDNMDGGVYPGQSFFYGAPIPVPPFTKL
ncbi:hypothetical protein PLICRDRAFT_103908 [Plicaturopsis crispa FD-325 SS-3]|nr:hypothetical protein PLICRDRAFT_103908 [Plicaturopsis crispa FD-325 SS-3]